MVGANQHLTYKGNLGHTRYGWMRLTPAYSIHLVADLLSARGPATGVVLDPFCGTGTTALVCAEKGIPCVTTDINPFLVWFSRVKTTRYSEDEITTFMELARTVQSSIFDLPAPRWTPPIHQIEKWWSDTTQASLARMMWTIRHIEALSSPRVIDLLKVAFCRVLIELANVSFAHQSMSFKRPPSAPMYELLLRSEEWVAQSWSQAIRIMQMSAGSDIASEPTVIECDARVLTQHLNLDTYAHVLTSPPYPNRMSYIRELRPYMYWLGYLSDGREAGELDWQAIGGTWGIATSNVGKWTPETAVAIPFDGFPHLLNRIGEHSPLLSRYVHKYFYDMVAHLNQLFLVVKPGGAIDYIVGNSKFYDVLLPVERIFAAMFEASGFQDIEIATIRKRSSKRELFEYVVSAKKPRAS